MAITAPSPAAFRSKPAWTWLPAAVGLLLLFLPTYLDLASGYWSSERGAHGPILLCMWLWLVWRERGAWRDAPADPGPAAAGWAALSLGVVLYALGRSQQMIQLEAGSQLLILPGICRILLGAQATRRLWFVWLFLGFSVPMPGSLVDSLLLPMKEWISAAVTQLLYLAGLPIARDGVVIYVGPYQMFIADACSGLNQLVALTAVGTLYVYVAGRRSQWQALLLLAAILPVASIANFLRVTTLVLATYLGGDALGQQLHGVVGYAEIVLAFGAFFLLDHLVRRGRRHRA